MAVCITYNVRGGKALPCTIEELNRARAMVTPESAQRLKDITAEMAWVDPATSVYQALDEEKKKIKLSRPALLPHAQEFEDFERKNDKAKPSGLVLFDIDHYAGNPRDFYDEKIAPRVHDWNIAEVELSASGDGLHILFRKPLGMTIQEAQKWMSENLDVPYDEGTFDLARCCFVVDPSYVLYQNDDLLLGEYAISEEEMPLYRGKALKGRNNIGLGVNPINATTTHTTSPRRSAAGEGERGEAAGNGVDTPSSDMSPLQGSLGVGDRQNDSAHALSSDMSPLQGSLGVGDRQNDSAHALSSDMSPLQGSPLTSSQGIKTLPIEGEMPEGQRGSAFSLKAFDLCLEEAGLTQSEIDIPGERNWHNTLKAVLSVGLCQIVEQGQLLAVLKQRMPNYAETDDCKRLVADFYRNYTDENGRMSITLRRIYATAIKSTPRRSAAGGEGGETTGNGVYTPSSDMSPLQGSPLTSSQGIKTLPITGEMLEEQWGSSAPALPKKLPPLVEHLISNVADMYKPAVATAIFPALAAHLHGVTFRYVDNVETHAGLSTLLISMAGLGKSCVNKPIENIIADFTEHDEFDRMRIQQWMDNVKKCSDKDHRPLRPTDVYIQVPESDMTSAALIQMLMDLEKNGERCLYQKLDEVELLGKIRSTGGCDTDRLICLGYDRAKYGAERVSANSVQGNPHLRWNWNASTTPVGARKFLRGSLINGTLSRLDMCTIFKPKVQRDKNGKRKRSLPVYGKYDEEFYEKLEPYIDNLNAANGEVVSEDVNNLILDIIDNCEDVMEETQDSVYENLWHRAVMIGFRKAMVLYIASGYEWTKEMSDFIKWSVEYNLWVKMYYFHELMRQELYQDELLSNANILDARCTVKALFNQLPNKFTTQELKEIRSKNGQGTNVKMVLSRWRNNKWIVSAGKNSWEKALSI